MASESEGETTFSRSGGAGSISYTLAEIAEAGAGIARLAQLVEPLLDRLQSERVWLGDAAQTASDYPYGALESMQHALWVGRQAQIQAVSLARKLAQAGDSYAGAEARTATLTAQNGRVAALQDGLATWGWGALAAVKLLADATAWMRQAKDKGLRDGVEDLLNNGAAYAAGAAGPLVAMSYLISQLRPHDAAKAGIQPAKAARSFLDAAGVARPGHLTMRPVPAEEWNKEARQWPPGHAVADPSQGEPWTTAASISVMLAETQAAYSYPPGSIGVLQVVRPDGSPAWVVNLPGTEDWSTLDSTNPFDMEGNLEGLTAEHMEAYKQQHVVVQDLIKQALAASGALPDDEVLITGHSGGGIHAAAAAASPEFLNEINVKMIVIAGAPAKNLDVAEGVSVLALENENDIVTAADFGAPAATANWVTVTSHRPAAAGSGDVGTLVKEAHAIENYVSDAVALESSDIPAVLTSQQTLAAFLGVGVGAVVQARKFVYQGRDVDEDAKNKGRTVTRAPSAGGPDALKQGGTGASKLDNPVAPGPQ
ncbi:hypothetical protein ART_2854 [Arthrobacter sp. PAMC 25486]|uniref:hypothetical protein n=1 Tax=Arthrobacter sp. PAMC 25486 TaxID=1494608 RepID=UPI000535D12C|nr:hypothetical protein [Arthrobacter sp. PAMC 25486]AIY02453.1 hypothetical protein ART_2854 [Arthrobacter sp. PAMC 25486]